MSFTLKRTYLSHLKKCSNQNSVQLKHVVNFAAKTTTINESKSIILNKKKTENRIIKMEIPKTEDDEQQQLVKF
jgi:queuine/archaeosine tRNA-ribosyltransferase